MVSVPVKNDSSGRKGLADLNYHMRDEHKEVRAEVVGEGQVLSQEDESKINEVAKVTNESEGVFQTQYGLQKLQQQPQVPVVRWERFLPLRSLKVLLVENDDSTRHVVSALLRNCSYEVIAAVNGLQAWKLLQDLTNHIDLVLTEVVMPCLSGIDLLCKIMSHKTCKNIPVIMMSSHDSMGIVFQCLSKGAVDFLVKPIRKNELKNLWQHVWRRCHSSSGSGSESGVQNQKHSESKSAEESGNNTGSNNEDDNGSIGLNARDGSDNGSGTQSSWTKRAVDIDSPQPLSPWNQLAETRDTMCVQVIHSKPEAFGNEWVPSSAAQERPEQDEQLDLKMALPRNPTLQSEFPNEKVSAFLTGSRHDTLPELETQKHKDQLAKEAPENSSENLINVITNSIDFNVENTDSISPSGLLKVSEIKDKALSDTKEIASLELTLKRPRGDGDARTPICDNRNVLRHSDFSAFTRYNTTSVTNQAPAGNVGSSLPNQGSNGSSNYNDMGSTTKNIFTKPATFTEKSESTSTMHNTHICPPQQVKPGDTHEKVQVQHHYHHYHHHHHHHHNMQKQPPDHSDFSLKNMEVATPQCGSSNMLGGSIDCNHGSASGSNHGSNTAMNTAGMNMDTDNGIKGEACGVSGSGNGLHQNRNAQREAALIKFRQKKKARCFEKKVRYHSRKRLAEQRPRVRGQFVRQMATEHKNQNEDS